MNLVKNVSGDWEAAKAIVRADLDTIQRTINLLLAKANAPVAATPAPPAIITPANHVNLPGASPMSSVATKSDGALDGIGTLASPLGVRVDGSTITVNAGNRLVGTVPAMTVHVGAAGALSGDGSVGSPLAVRVDNSSIIISGNNLVAATVEGTVLVTHLSLNNGQIGSLFSSPVQAIGAPAAGKMIRVHSFTARTRVGTGWGSNPILSLIYHGDAGANPISGGFQAPLGTVGDDKFDSTPAASIMGPLNTTVMNGKAVDVRFDSNPSGAGTSCTIDITIIYNVVTI